MPRLSDVESYRPHPIVASVGGSIVRPNELNRGFICEFLEFTKDIVDREGTVVAVIGGGGMARQLIGDARAMGVSHPLTLDQIGINVTRENAFVVAKIFEANGLHVHVRKPGDIFKNGFVYIQGGGEPGHTTDYVAVQAAREAHQQVLLNISSTQGLYRVTEGKMDKNDVIDSISWDDYLALFPKGHEPGINIPFDHEAALFAQKNAITVILIGPDIENISNLLAGKEFTGTIIHP
ncbi:MAG: hypothetical protein Q8L37_03410 [Candidatus Gottesmanbacteria bacterium]|nr:hypothetical protein [Candidatus Gottesmanbacteria bacterium]